MISLTRRARASRRLTLTLAVLQLTVLTRVSLPLLGVLPLLMPMPTLALLPFLTTPGVLLPLLHLLLVLLLLRGIGRVYQVLYAGDVVGGRLRLLLRVGVRARDGVWAVRGVHRVGRLVRRSRGGIRGVRLRVRLLLTNGVLVGAIVGARLGQVEGA